MDANQDRVVQAAFDGRVPLAEFRAVQEACERMRAALKPFADYADPTAVFPPTIEITNGSRLARRQLTMGDCYEAARVLEAHGQKVTK